MKIEITRNQVSNVYRELIRRMSSEIAEGVEDGEEFNTMRHHMLQGLYGTLMGLASNWLDVIRWCDEEEEKYGISPFDDWFNKQVAE